MNTKFLYSLTIFLLVPLFAAVPQNPQPIDKEKALQQLAALKQEMNKLEDYEFFGSHGIASSASRFGYLITLEEAIIAGRPIAGIMLGKLPLGAFVAKRNDCIAILKFMLDHGLPPDQEFVEETVIARTRKKVTCYRTTRNLLTCAIAADETLDNARLLLERRAKPQVYCPFYSHTPEDNPAIKLLMEHGARLEDLNIIKGGGGGLP